MIKVKIYGAGSIGNHYAYACYKKKWNITIIDKDPKALVRMEKKIFPSRYGFWDKKIKLLSKDVNTYFDIIIIGTPPESHLKLAIKNLRDKNRPKILQIEKPLCTPDLKNLNEFIKLKNKYKNKVKIFGGYNHLLTKNTKIAEKILKKEKFGKLLGLDSYNNEEWSGIFNAHFWLKSPKDSYLGFSKRGGGSLCEHSHGLAAWLHYSKYLKLGNIKKVYAKMKLIKKNSLFYDQISILTLETTKGFVGTVFQDTITKPALKKLRIQFSNGYLETYVNYKNNLDAVIYECNNKKKEYFIKKSRSDDFKGMVNHLGASLKNKKLQKLSAVSITRSIETMKIINTAFKSNQLKKEINKKI